MPKEQDVHEAVAEWVEKAESDVRTAELVIKASLAEIVCFHCQQCVEKYLKALLTLKGIPFSKTHSISLLDEMLGEAVDLHMTFEEMLRFTHYATTIRYPEALNQITVREARWALRTTQQVRRDIRRLLPRAAKPSRRSTPKQPPAGRAK